MDALSVLFLNDIAADGILQLLLGRPVYSTTSENISEQSTSD